MTPQSVLARICCFWTLSAVLVPPGMARGADKDWKLVRTQTVKHRVNVCGFENRDFGITVGYAGESHYTNDRGATWPQSSKVAAQCRFGLDIVDRSVAVSGGNGGVTVTENGGKTWENINRERHDILSFIDGRTGWIADNSSVSATADGGKSWSKVALPKELDGIRAIATIKPATGYILDKTGTLFLTTNGGQDWTAKPVKVSDPALKMVWLNNTIMRFQSADVGTIMAWAEKAGKTNWIVLDTRDGGNSWEKSRISGNVDATAYCSRNGRFITLCDPTTKAIALYSKP